MPASTTYDLPISGMTCASCAGRVERALRKVTGAEQVSVNLTTEKARVLAPPASLPALVEAVREAGYGVPTRTLELQIGGMTCASCVGRVERALGKLAGVEQVSVNLASERAHLEVLAALDDNLLIDAVQKAGYSASLPQSTKDDQSAVQRRLRNERLAVGAALLLALPLVLPMLVQPFGLHWMLPAWAQFLLATPVQFILGARFYIAAWKAVRAGAGNMDLLVALGTSAGYGLSLYQWAQAPAGMAPHLYFEASAVVIALVLLGKYLESRAKRQTASAIRALEALRPERALRVVDGVEEDVAIAHLRVGDLVLVKPGERFPVDGVVEDGSSHADEALISGEPASAQATRRQRHRWRHQWRRPAAGAYPGAGHRDRAGAHHPPGGRRPGRQSADPEAGRPCQPGVRPGRAGTGADHPDWLVAGWGTAGNRADQRRRRAGHRLPLRPRPGHARRDHGRYRGRRPPRHPDQGCRSPERAHAVNRVVFDKTGTLTSGSPRVVHSQALDGNSADLHRLAGALQRGSEHPLAKAVLVACAEQGLDVPTVADSQSLTGRGIAGRVEGRELALGNRRLLDESGLQPGDLAAQAQAWEAEGRTLSWLIERGAQPKVVGLFAFGDSLKPGAAQAIETLHAQHISSHLLTGDNRGSANVVAEALGIDDVHAEVLPADKAATVAALKQDGVVAMVGDGINDAPALAAADIGIAMGGGTDVAMQAAGITLMRGDPRLVPAALEISRKTYAKIRQNLFWAFIYNLIGIPLAALGYLNPVLAGAAMALSSVSVVSNALWLKTWKPTSSTQEAP